MTSPQLLQLMSPLCGTRGSGGGGGLLQLLLFGKYFSTSVLEIYSYVFIYSFTSCLILLYQLHCDR